MRENYERRVFPKWEERNSNYFDRNRSEARFKTRSLGNTVMSESWRERCLNRYIDRTGYSDQNYHRNLVRYERFNQREDSVTIMQSASSELCFVEVVLGGLKVPLLLDSGAGTTIIDEKVWKAVRRNGAELVPVSFPVR